MISFSHSFDESFITKRYKNWKHAVSKFTLHEKSLCQKESVCKFSSYKTNSIATQLNKQLISDQENNRTYLLLLFNTLRFLARQGLATRGYTDQDSKYHRLLQLQANEFILLKNMLYSDKKSG